MKTLKKKIIKADNTYEFEKLVEEHEYRGWKMMSDVKRFCDERFPFQVLVGLELEVNK